MVRTLKGKHWSIRTALLIGDNHEASESCPYWKIPRYLIPSSLSDHDDTEADKCIDHSGINSLCVSYGTFFTLVAELAMELHTTLMDRCLLKICNTININRNNCLICVAIPTGPLLPISITTVHAMNHQISNHYNAIMVPIDPKDGFDRLCAMLDVVRPIIVLVASDHDAARIQSCFHKLKIKIGNGDDNAANVRDDCTSTLQQYPVNFVVPSSENNNVPIVLNVNTILSEKLLFEKQQQQLSKRRDKFSKVQQELLHLDEDENVPIADIVKRCANALMQKNTHENINNEDESNFFCARTNNCASSQSNFVSHVVFTSGTTGRPKGCVASYQSLCNYICSKNHAHNISRESIVYLASAVGFDPCLSDIISTVSARATIATCSTSIPLGLALQKLSVTHILCTPSLWATVPVEAKSSLSSTLQVIALGGERIPNHMILDWARSNDALTSENPTETRLCITYGTTEACVYQTFGEVWKSNSDDAAGQVVGKLLDTVAIKIQRQTEIEQQIEGEIVISGNQVDEISSYLNDEELSKRVFGQARDSSFYYRTGDKGIINEHGHLRLFGRMDGAASRMVKYNGIRVELEEIEDAIVDNISINQRNSNDIAGVVTGAVLVAEYLEKNCSTATDLTAYVTLSSQSIQEMKILSSALERGILCSESPLLLMLRHRCAVRTRITPTTFVLLATLPLSRTGKRSKTGLPSASTLMSLGAVLQQSKADVVLLEDYSAAGTILSEEVIKCLNLQSAQKLQVTTTTTFGFLGGDSLAATKVVRTLYARYKGIHDTRRLGGQYGTLAHPFLAQNLIQASSLGQYADLLDQHGSSSSDICKSDDMQISECDSSLEQQQIHHQIDSSSSVQQLYDALIHTITCSQTTIAAALLALEASVHPIVATGTINARLGKNTDRRERAKIFQSSPIHIACQHGNVALVRLLILYGSRLNTPNSLGLFPIHLAVCGMTSCPVPSPSATGSTSSLLTSNEQEHQQRAKCVELLFSAGVPLFIKDGSNQTVLHTAARIGNIYVLTIILKLYQEKIFHERSCNGNQQQQQHSATNNKKRKKGKKQECFLDWRDNWGRTAVHWSVLNNRLHALRVLLDAGCDPNPFVPAAKHVSSSVALETPLQICRRLYGSGNDDATTATEDGKSMESLLLCGKYKRTE